MQLFNVKLLVHHVTGRLSKVNATINKITRFMDLHVATGRITYHVKIVFKKIVFGVITAHVTFLVYKPFMESGYFYGFL